jgi:peptide/nickel transport system substrate-binding protein
MFFGHNVSEISPYLEGPYEGQMYPTYALDESGIPPTFFADPDVRKGFAYSVNYTQILEDVFLGEAIQPSSPLCQGLAPDCINPTLPLYELDPVKAEQHFKDAYGGELWTTGFTTGVAYNIGNPPRQTVCEMLKTNIEALNPKFHINVVAVDWGSVYIPQLVSFQLNMYIIGWGADYPDPHNFMYTFMGTYGDFSYFQRVVYPDSVGGINAIYGDPGLVSNAYVDDLLVKAFLAPTEDRCEMYTELQDIYFEACASVCTWEAIGRRWQRDWLQGWYYNGIYPGSYAYPLWKEELPLQDIDENGKVEVKDILLAAGAYGSYFTPEYTDPDWDSKIDINGDWKIDVKDILEMAKMFGWVAPPWTAPP